MHGADPREHPSPPRAGHGTTEMNEYLAASVPYGRPGFVDPGGPRRAGATTRILPQYAIRDRRLRGGGGRVGEQCASIAERSASSTPSALTSDTSFGLGRTRARPLARSRARAPTHTR